MISGENIFGVYSWSGAGSLMNMPNLACSSPSAEQAWSLKVEKIQLMNDLNMGTQMCCNFGRNGM